MLLFTTPFYYLNNSLNFSVLYCFLITYIISVLSINLGWHRYYTHNMFNLNVVLRFVFLFFGTSVFFGKISDWTIEHLNHHKHFGTDKDPMKSNKGFFSQAYWMIFNTDKCPLNKQHESDDLFVFFNNNWALMTLLSNIILVFLTYILSGDIAQSLIWIVVIRINLVFHLYTITHSFGHYKMDKFLHVFNAGEGEHEEHHRKPNQNMKGFNVTYLFFNIFKSINFIKEKNE